MNMILINDIISGFYIKPYVTVRMITQKLFKSSEGAK